MRGDGVPEAWWLEMPNGACIMHYAAGEQTVSVAAEFVDAKHTEESGTHIRFRTFPVSGHPPIAAPREVRLLAIVGGSSCVFVLPVITFAQESVVVESQPLSLHRRPLRRYPRTPYHLGPCTAVVHSAVRQWRGLVEFWVQDVSAQGVGFAVVAHHADRVMVGDYLRSPVTLPDGTRSWIDGEVIWLTSDGRGGLLTRRAPEWHAEAHAPVCMALP